MKQKAKSEEKQVKTGGKKVKMGIITKRKGDDIIIDSYSSQERLES